MDNQELRTNKQELINKYELIKNVFNFDVVATDDIISDLKRLDEPQKPVVPQFVADWYEIHKDSFEPDLFACIRDILNDGCVANISEFEHWILGRKDSITTLVNMHQFGYTVEKEKRYVINFKNIQEHHSFLNFSAKTEKWLFSIPEGDTLYRTHHTRKELEDAGFGWIFSCEGIEVKEVE